MKKTWYFILAIIISFTLFACGKSSAVQDVELLISGIGKISLDSEPQIQAAQFAYDQLDPDEKNEVQNIMILENAKTQLTILRNVSKVEAFIQAIGTVDLDSEPKIQAAEQAYTELGSEAQQQVSNSDILIAARTEFDTLVADYAAQSAIWGAWEGSIAGLSMLYVFNEDGTYSQHIDDFGNPFGLEISGGSGTYTYDPESGKLTLYLNGHTTIIDITVADTRLVMTTRPSDNKTVDTIYTKVN